jgi:hypothetical protein
MSVWGRVLQGGGGGIRTLDAVLCLLEGGV